MDHVRFEQTPNPSTMKFVLPVKVTDGTHDFATARDAELSPLASKIFGFPWTSRVFLGPDFITVTKQDWVEWDILAEPLSGLIQEHLDRGEPILLEIDRSVVADNDEFPDDPTIVKEIKRALNREIRPVVAMDGGDVVFNQYKDNVLVLEMKGACAGCPSSSATLKEGIEVRMKELFPEIKEVVGV